MTNPRAVRGWLQRGQDHRLGDDSAKAGALELAQLPGLEATARQFFGDSPDLDLAGAADIQGIGGPAPQNLAAARKEVVTEVPR